MKLGFGLYIIASILLLVFSYAFVDFNLSYMHFFYTGLVNTHRVLTVIIYLFLIILLYLGYIFLLQSGVHLVKIKKFLLLIFTLLIFSYPAMLSYDIFNYIATGKVTYYYHENPYIVMPIEFINDPLLSFTRATNKVALYGPVWIAVSSIPFNLGFSNFIISLFSFKFLTGLFYFGSCYLIYKISKQELSMIIFALNPLVIIETFVSGHNDISMMFLALAGIYFLKKNKIYIALLFLLLSILIKFATIFLLPIFLVKIYHDLKKKHNNYEKFFEWCFYAMALAFLLSIFREEIYPWYAVWLITFSCFLIKKNIVQHVLLFFTFGLMMRYVPYILTGSYAGLTPVVKEVVTITFLIIGFISFYIQRIWKKQLLRLV